MACHVGCATLGGAGGIGFSEEAPGTLDRAVVVALPDGERVTVKKLYREGELVRLRPQDGDHEDIVVPADRVQIQGRVTHVMHPPAR